jgi:hypothetical protein
VIAANLFGERRAEMADGRSIWVCPLEKVGEVNQQSLLLVVGGK